MKNIMIESLIEKLISSARATNYHADYPDIKRNHVNYGSTVACAAVLRDFGVVVDVPVWEDRGCLRIPKITINEEVYQLNTENTVYILMAIYDMRDCVDLNGETAGEQEEIKGIFKSLEDAEERKNILDSESSSCEDECYCDSVTYRIAKWNIE